MPRYISSILVQVDADDPWAAAAMVNNILDHGHRRSVTSHFVKTSPLTADDFDPSDDQTELRQVSDDPADRAGELKAPLYGEDPREFIDMDDDLDYDGDGDAD